MALSKGLVAKDKRIRKSRGKVIVFELQVETTRVALREGGVELRLRIVDTPGFGDAVDNSNW